MHLFYQAQKELIDVFICFSARLEEVAAEVSSELLPLLCRDRPVVLHVALVPRQDEARRPLRAPLGLPVELDHVLERQRRVDGVDEDKALPHRHVLLAEDAVLVLPRGVQDVQHHGGVLDGDLLAEVGLDGRVVHGDELTVHVALRESTLANTY